MPNRDPSLPVFVLAILISAPTCPASGGRKPEGGSLQELGEPSHGLRAVLSANRTTFSPGEVLELSGYLWNTSSHRLVLPHEHHPWPAGELHLRTPQGELYVYAPKERVLPDSSFCAIPPGRVDRLRDIRIRLNDSNPGWGAKEKKDTEPRALGLRGEGVYRIWFEYEIPPTPKAGEHGWSGKATSNVLTITLRAMPAEKRCATPTPEQLGDLERMISGQPGVTNEEQALRGLPYHRLQEAMLLTENEGLAVEIAKRVVASWDGGRPKWFENCLAMLVERAGDGLSAEGPGVDGPYLKLLANGILGRLRAGATAEGDAEDDAVQRGRQLARQHVSVVVAYARLNPGDGAFRRQLVDVLERSARVADLPQWQTPAPEGRSYPPVGLTTAWQALLMLGLLRDGMAVEEAIGVLGEPTTRTETSIRWYYETPRHVNPVISAEIKDGKIVSFRVGRA